MAYLHLSLKIIFVIVYYNFIDHNFTDKKIVQLSQLKTFCLQSAS